MIKSSTKSVSFFLVLCLLSVALSTSALAQRSKKDEKNTRETKQTVAMSQSTYESLQKVNELVLAGSVEEGLAELEKFRNSKAGQKLSPYETAQTWNLTALRLLFAGTLSRCNSRLCKRIGPA